MGLHSKLEQNGTMYQVDYELYATNYKNSFLGPENILLNKIITINGCIVQD
jgi:hypothetical protein